MERTALATRPARRAAGGGARRCRTVIRSLPCAEPGAPAWVDLGTPTGTTPAARFYCGLFGWSVVARHRPLDDPVGYWIFRQGGRDVGGLAPANEATWTMYIGVTDVEATARAVTANGGTVPVGPLRTVEGGRLAGCADPSGARFVVWEPAPSGGYDRADRADRPASATWPQLVCRDVEAAARFYGAVFGWEARAPARTSGSSCAELVHPETGRTVAGMVAMNEAWLEGVQPQWMILFAVADTARAAARAVELGGAVAVGPFDLPGVGRVAVLDDPDRATFSVFEAA